ncbi:Smr/MutS family protein [Thiomicrorhabdus sp.]|uniref:Smr/MutS family protein n=1 Tax=Thiomicrorhabdus sp. TaxID=2039724 RepID=UPI0029C71729|nr:Smr/MutS family protein [Thiomicrorhabdus sp.]
MTDEDKSLFLSEMLGVQPLKQGKHIQTHDPSQDKKKQNQALRQLRRKQKQTEIEHVQCRLLERDESINPVSAHQSLLFSQKGVRIQDINALKKGEFPLQAELDLHGETLEEAESKLLEFMKECLFHKLRYIRIIHGKGYHSDQDHPLLKNMVNRGLRLSSWVLAFSSAPQKDGGAGAVNVLLKKQG